VKKINYIVYHILSFMIDKAIIIILIITAAVLLGGKAAIVLLLGAILWLKVRTTEDTTKEPEEEPSVLAAATGSSCSPIDVYADTDPFNTNTEAPAWPFRGEHKPTACYDPPIELPTAIHKNIDDLVTEMAAARSRDRRAIDGAVTKTADYYKRHYGDELDQSEAKVWWGNNDW
jgi:hypothetical protein